MAWKNTHKCFSTAIYAHSMRTVHCIPRHRKLITSLLGTKINYDNSLNILVHLFHAENTDAGALIF